MQRCDVLQLLKETGAPQWKLADAVGISEPTLTRWLRHPLEGDRLARVTAGLAALREEAV